MCDDVHMDPLEDIPISYRKNKNGALLKSFEQPEVLNVSGAQNYLSIYKRFFSLNESNWNSVNLNNKWELEEVSRKPGDKVFSATVVDSDTKKRKVQVFFKLSPLIEPLKYMTGKYASIDDTLFSLPTLEGSGLPKMDDINNSAYVDGFFTYLTSKLLHRYGFIHGLDFYGSYLGIKEDFPFNVEEDLEFLYRSDFFHLHKGSRFQIDNAYYDDILNIDSRKFKKKLSLGKSIDNISISSNSSLDRLSDVISSEEPASATGAASAQGEVDLVFHQEEKATSTKSTRSSCSHCSSRSSVTGDEKEQDSEDEEEEVEEDDNDDDSELSDEVEVSVLIKRFPVQIIALEACEDTLDSLIETDICYAEVVSALMQIIMTLITYQKAFDLTHNDLHTNNVMYVSTEKQYIYYRYESAYYKVPTFGRIYKIIDFGRGIYRYKGHHLVSDSFDKDGDAATQYNMEPFMNDKKPRLDPNSSFDLCRLACSLFDVFVPPEDDDVDSEARRVSNPELYNPVKDLIEDWCKDDKDRNVLYKTHGEERYPSFKLYKMIARTVHKHTPEAQLKRDIFANYKVSRKSLPRKPRLVDIDKIPVMV